MKDMPSRLIAGCEDDPGSGDIYREDGSLFAEAFINGGHKSRVRNARRLAACWNACDGIKTKDLERYYGAGSGIDQAMEEASLSDHANAIKQRDELLQALCNLAKLYDAMGAPRGPCRIIADAVIAKATGKSAPAVSDTVNLQRAGRFGGAE
jgi:hypothetical protein